MVSLTVLFIQQKLFEKERYGADYAAEQLLWKVYSIVMSDCQALNNAGCRLVYSVLCFVNG